jgi:hypothetical protein
MFGLFKKSFESEMEEYSKRAKYLGTKYGCNDSLNALMNIIFDPKLRKEYDKDMTELLKKRIDCCKKHGRYAEMIEHEQQLAKHRSMMG